MYVSLVTHRCSGVPPEFADSEKKTEREIDNILGTMSTPGLEKLSMAQILQRSPVPQANNC